MHYCSSFLSELVLTNVPFTLRKHPFLMHFGSIMLLKLSILALNSIDFIYEKAENRLIYLDLRKVNGTLENLSSLKESSNIALPPLLFCI